VILARALHGSATAVAIEAVATAAHAGADEKPATAVEKEHSELLAALLEGRADAELLGALGDRSRTDLLRLAQLARALRLAYAPTKLDEVTHQRILQAGLKTPSRVAARRTITAAVFVLVAAAAAIFGLFIDRRPSPAPSTAMHRTGAFVDARSSVDLFDPMKPFDREKGTTERVDKITTTRSSELRDNLFNAWGIE
jgi:hypothetical protein